MEQWVLLVLAIVSPLFSIAIAFGAAIVFRSSIARTASEIQERVIGALQSEVLALTTKVEQLEKANTRLTVILEIIQRALKARDIFVTIDGEMVTVSDAKGTQQSSERVKI